MSNYDTTKLNVQGLQWPHMTKHKNLDKLVQAGKQYHLQENNEMTNLEMGRQGGSDFNSWNSHGGKREP